jgi:hypothetical protein
MVLQRLAINMPVDVGSNVLVYGCIRPTHQSVIFGQQTLHVLLGQSYQDLKGRFCIVRSLPPPRKEDNATIARSVCTPDELGSPSEGVLAQVRPRYTPGKISTKVEPRRYVHVRTELDRQCDLRVRDSIDRFEERHVARYPVVINTKNGALDLLYDVDDSFFGYTAHACQLVLLNLRRLLKIWATRFAALQVRRSMEQ